MVRARNMGDRVPSCRRCPTTDVLQQRNRTRSQSTRYQETYNTPVVSQDLISAVSNVRSSRPPNTHQHGATRDSPKMRRVRGSSYLPVAFTVSRRCRFVLLLLYSVYIIGVMSVVGILRLLCVRSSLRLGTMCIAA